ncbi:outer membrane beta-barrel family protein [Pedobacter duraquae]|uniref:Outer membrane receptor protein involved in Fe transport n=1 Tax=Pedobacter duraquae TaxID=425511 RepID=A0A4R6IGL9_9SPHI|nr:outer membrane beta-barrel family protein [Pedobacter duraquae]TDO21503.1 outer membrane receptor protein involved in Fe transport [Pedobacter duraquae]
MKKHLSKVLYLITILCCLTVKLSAQTTGPGKITAKIIDAQTNEGISFATAMVLDRKTKATVKLAQTDADGNLNMSNIPEGVFTFKVSYVGYQTLVRDSIKITTAAPNQVFGTVKMRTAKGNTLSEVKITAPKSTMQMGIDKKVFSVDQSLVSEGGSATDLLQNVPSVQTDMDGNISLRGSTGVRVLIDGKPSLIAGGNVAQILQSIPASSIESVEVITNPSSKYDAEGQSGIINIVLKRNKTIGFNGNVALTAGNRDNYNANTSLSFQNSKVNIYGNYSYRYANRIGGGYNNITYLNPASTTAFAEQNTASNSQDKGHNVKAGLDYYLAPKSVLSFSGSFNNRNNDRNEDLTINQYSRTRTPVQLSNRTNINDGSGNSYDLNLDYSQKFKKPKEELTFNFGFSQGSNNNLQTYKTSIYNRNGAAVNELVAQRNDGEGLNKNYNIQSDYALPVGAAGKIEAGYRSQIRFADQTTFADILNPVSGQYETDYILTNAFNSKEQIHALYFNYQNTIKSFGYQLGLRGEDAKLNTSSGIFNRANQPVFTPGQVAYTRLYPSVFLTEKLKGDQQLQLSYSRRVNRPRGMDTNPFIDASDPLNYRTGNVNLKPEDVHAFEFSYSKFWKKVTFISSVYYRQTNDVIQRVLSDPDANGVTISTPQNLTRNISSGLELISKVDLIKVWNFTTNVNLYQSKLEGAPQYGIAETSGFSWNANLTNNFTLPYGITMQVRGDYRSSEVMAQGKRNAMYGIDGGAKYDFPNKKASLSLNIRDIFNTRKWSMTRETNTTVVDFQRYMQGTMGNLTFSYRFGKSDFQSKKPKKNDQQDQRPDEEQF